MAYRILQGDAGERIKAGLPLTPRRDPGGEFELTHT